MATFVVQPSGELFDGSGVMMTGPLRQKGIVLRFLFWIPHGAAEPIDRRADLGNGDVGKGLDPSFADDGFDSLPDRSCLLGCGNGQQILKKILNVVRQ